ncbi:MAG: cation:proton antiporter [Pseudomonadota bacterium]
MPQTMVQANEGMVVVALMLLFTPLVMSYPIMALGPGFPGCLLRGRFRCDDHGAEHEGNPRGRTADLSVCSCLDGVVRWTGSLAIPGVVAAIGLTPLILTPVANTLHFVQDFTWKHALVFGTIISATDPITVVSIFKSLGVPKRLVLLEGESLLNDGTAIVFFTLSIALVTGTGVTPGGLALDFLKIVGLGAFIGMGVGLTVSQVIRQVDDPMIEITLTTIAAYGSFLAAEHFHYSGVIATVAAGMLCGNMAPVSACRHQPGSRWKASGNTSPSHSTRSSSC